MKLYAIKCHEDRHHGNLTHAAQGRQEMRMTLMNVFTIASDKLFNLFIAAYAVAKKKQSLESCVQECNVCVCVVGGCALRTCVSVSRVMRVYACTV